METLIVVTEGSDDTTPIFVSPPNTLYATIGMEVMMSFDIVIDDISNDLIVTSLTMLPTGVTVDPIIVTANDTG